MANEYQYINPTGLIVPETSQLLLDVQNSFKAAFGSDLVVTPDTPQGVLITMLTLARAAMVNNNAALANQINPNKAAGVYLDAIMALTGVERYKATKTVVMGVTLTGVPGTFIDIGTQAQTTENDLFELLSAVTLDGSGNAVGNFASVEFGPIPCPADTLIQVVTDVFGWETVNNPDAGVLGKNEQSDISARAFRLNTLAYQGVALPIAITSALYNVTGVQSLTFLENVTGSTITYEGVSVIAHSIYVCVNGGSDLDVAAALLENKSMGCGWNGGTTVDIIEPVSGQEYAVKFDRPTEVPMLVRVTIQNGKGDPDNVKDAIMQYVAGEIDGETGFVVGSDVSAFEIAGAVSTLFPGTFMTKVEISKVTPESYTTDAIPINVNQIATLQRSSISVLTV